MATTAVKTVPALLLLLTVILSWAAAQLLRTSESINPCANVKTCGECIRTAKICAWCAAENFTTIGSRCDLFEHLKSICPSEHLAFPVSNLNIAKNDNVRGGDGTSQPIQVQPQTMDITARTNEPINFKLMFRQAENYPVDLYFLLDLSYTMVEQEEAQKNLIRLGQYIPRSIENITKDFNLGFGTFVDKTVLPYTAWTDQLLRDRCPLPDKNCRPPHDFINQLKLSKSDGDTFADRMKQALQAVSQSFDDSEGGMDGLMQALVCENDIGWRERSRRIIVYSSNSLFHLAGDGLLGGATRNPDGECYLDSDGSYSPNDVKFDFPSVGQIANKLDEKSTSVIFAVMPNVVSHYDRLGFMVANSVVGRLSDKSGNIIELIRNNYDKLRSRIHFIPRRADGVKFTFRSKCKGDVMQETDMCDNLEIKENVTFEVSMTVSSDVCEGQSGIVERSVELAAKGLNEQLTINLKIICDCECERPEKEEKASDKCFQGNGTFECGICNCNPSRYGRHCECDETTISTEKSLEECRLGNDTQVCSGQGECVCGVCECFPISYDTDKRYSKKHCQCNDYSCPRAEDDGSLCGGPTRGKCDCGECICLDGWSGPACDCKEDNSTCIASTGELCNMKGECVCGRCQCDPRENYMGPQCEECPDCPSKCAQYRDCAQCRAFGTGKHSADVCADRCDDVTMVDELEEGNDRVFDCHFRDTDECLFHFTYEYDDQNFPIIKVQRTKECPEEVNLALILGPVVAGIVLIPLLLLCIFIFIRNRRDAAEFARFMKEKDKARWESAANPIYKDPKSTFKNPTYKGGK